MAGRAIVTADAQLRVQFQNVQEELAKMAQAIDKVQIGTKIEREMNKAFMNLRSQANQIGSSLSKSFSSQGEIDRLKKSIMDLSQQTNDFAKTIRGTQFGDLIISKEDSARVTDFSNKLKALEAQIGNLGKGSTANFLKTEEFQKIQSAIKFDIGKDPMGDGLENSLNKARAAAERLLSVTERLANRAKNLTVVTPEGLIDEGALDRLRTQFQSLFDEGLFTGKGTFKSGMRSQIEAIALEAGSAFNDTLKQQLLAGDLESVMATLFDSSQVQANIAKINEAGSSLNSYKQRVQDVESAQMRWNQTQATNASEMNYLQNELNTTQTEYEQLRSSIVSSTLALDKVDDATANAGAGMQSLIQGADRLSDSFEQMNGQIKTMDQIKSAVNNWFSLAMVINTARNAIRNAYSSIKELDQAMTDIAVVTNFTTKELWGQIDAYMATAQAYGVTTQGVYEVSQLYYQMGLKQAEVTELTTETLKMARIANIDYADATDYMTVALLGFNMQMSEAARVTDVYSEIAAISATDTEELAIAMSKTASGAESVGASFENTTALMALMLETHNVVGFSKLFELLGGPF